MPQSSLIATAVVAELGYGASHRNQDRTANRTSDELS